MRTPEDGNAVVSEPPDPYAAVRQNWRVLLLTSSGQRDLTPDLRGFALRVGNGEQIIVGVDTELSVKDGVGVLRITCRSATLGTYALHSVEQSAYGELWMHARHITTEELLQRGWSWAVDEE